MIEISKNSRETTTILFIPIAGNFRKLSDNSIKLECNCQLQKKRISKVESIRSLLDEIQGTQNWKENYFPKRTSRYALAGKILIKSPGLLRGILFGLKGYDLMSSNDCQNHSLKSKRKNGIWYSNSASRIGFPWSCEVFTNSLNAIRDLELEGLVFSNFEDNSEPGTDSFCESIEIVKKKLEKSIYVNIQQSVDIENTSSIISWRDSKLFQIEKAQILHGTVLLQNGKFVSQDEASGPFKIPGRMTPCSVWSDKRLQPQKEILVSPHAKNEVATIDSGLFINASLSFYHFISESLRPLVQSIENGIEIENIIIRNDLPFQFYELVSFLSPNSVQILVGKGEKILINNLLAGVLEDRLSITSKVFSEYTLDNLRMSDEWRVWSWIRNISNFNTLGNEVLYLPRRKSESRGIYNSVSLEETLDKNNVKILETSQSDFYTQCLHFNNSKLVCSTTGASLVNMIFMPSGSTLLELTYPSGLSWKFLAELCGIQHISFPMNSLKPKELENMFDTYYVNKKKLNQVIEKLV